MVEIQVRAMKLRAVRGEGVTPSRQLQEVVESCGEGYKLAAVFPTMIAYFGTSPERYETVEVMVVCQKVTR